MPDLADFFGPAVITPLWIFLGAALGIHGIWRAPMTCWRIAGIGMYAVFGLLLAGASWWYGAVQIQTTRIAQKAQAIAETLSAAEQKGLRDQLKQSDGRLAETQDRL